jgi:hypothetical protein
MITVRLWGGIGNQLFQYAFGEYLRMKTKQEVRYDIASFGNSDKLRKLALEILNPELPISTDIKFSRYTRYKNRFYRLLFQLNPKNKFIIEDKFSLEAAYTFKDSKHYYLQGYWQNSICPNELLKVDKRFFIPRENLPPELQNVKKTIVESQHSVALHIRCGDYLRPENINIFGVCDAAYYHKGMDLLTQKQGSVKFFVFSDDLDWVKNNITLPSNAVFIPNFQVNPYWYIVLMSECKHNIISNSSFSWWGAYLNNHNDKTVICPQKWTLTSEKTIVLSKWLKL